MGRKKKEVSEILTELELSIMQILWRVGCGGVADVQMELPEDKPLAYTTVSTVLRLLEKKGFVMSEKEGRAHIYLPAVAQEAYEAKHLNHVVKSVFSDTPMRMVKRLLDTEDMSVEDIHELRRLLNDRV